MGKIFFLLSDNISLKYLFDQQNMNARQARWLAFFREYNFEINDTKEKENKMADALSIDAITSFIDSISNCKIESYDKLG